MGSSLNNLTVIHNQNLVCLFNRCQSVCNLYLPSICINEGLFCQFIQMIQGIINDSQYMGAVRNWLHSPVHTGKPQKNTDKIQENIFLFLSKKIAIRLHFLKSYSFAINEIKLLFNIWITNGLSDCC